MGGSRGLFERCAGCRSPCPTRRSLRPAGRRKARGVVGADARQHRCCELVEAVARVGTVRDALFKQVQTDRQVSVGEEWVPPRMDKFDNLVESLYAEDELNEIAG